jgi:endonuclease G
MKCLKSFVWIACIILFSCSHNNESVNSTTSDETEVLLGDDSIELSENEEKDANAKVAVQDKSSESEITVPIEWASVDHSGPVVTHLGYSFSYKESYEQAAWVAYVLTAAEVQGTVSRSDDFREDLDVTTGSATDADYKGSGFDRGHLAPAADMKWSKQAMEESFYYSNMSPQIKGFNRGIWKELEELVRDWAAKYDSLYVVTGPVFSKNMLTIGPNKVAVPPSYYKIVLDLTHPNPSAIGFVIPNESSSLEPYKFVKSIDEIERLTGLDFYVGLPDDVEFNVEQRSNVNAWDWHPVHASRNKVPNNYEQESNSNNPQMNNSVQCSGITKKGKRCKNKTTAADGRCHLHH